MLRSFLHHVFKTALEAWNCVLLDSKYATERVTHQTLTTAPTVPWHRAPRPTHLHHLQQALRALRQAAQLKFSRRHPLRRPPQARPEYRRLAQQRLLAPQRQPASQRQPAPQRQPLYRSPHLVSPPATAPRPCAHVTVLAIQQGNTTAQQMGSQTSKSCARAIMARAMETAMTRPNTLVQMDSWWPEDHP